MNKRRETSFIFHKAWKCLGFTCILFILSTLPFPNLSLENIFNRGHYTCLLLTYLRKSDSCWQKSTFWVCHTWTRRIITQVTHNMATTVTKLMQCISVSVSIIYDFLFKYSILLNSMHFHYEKNEYTYSWYLMMTWRNTYI